MKRKNQVLRFFLVASFVFVFFFNFVTQPFAKTIVDKKTKKSYKLVESREELIDEFKKHVFNLDKSFKIYVSSDVVGNFQKEFKGIWKELCEDIRFNEIWERNTAYKSQFKDYSESKAKCWEWNVSKMLFSIDKKRAKEMIESMENVVQSKEDLVRVYTSNVLGLKTNFSILISKKAFKNFDKDYKSFMKKANKNPDYVKLIKYAEIKESKQYVYKDFWKWDVQIDYNISDETAAEVLNESQKILKSDKQVVDEFIKYIKRLDKRIILKIDKDKVDLSNETQYNNLWTKLLMNPVFGDIFPNTKKFDHKVLNFKDHREWVINLQYGISKKEVKALDTFVENALADILDGKKTDEEKVRAINDYMADTYKLNYTSKGKSWYFSGDNSSNAKLGKYNINTSFALFYKNGGSSDGFAHMFYQLAKKAGLDSKLISGKKDGHRFIWNLVKVDKKWYHISTIHNMDDGGVIDKDYHYLKSDSTMEKTYSEFDSSKLVEEKDF